VKKGAREAVGNRYQVEKLFTKEQFSSKSLKNIQPSILSYFLIDENSYENEEKMSIIMIF